jgi:uncharacterized membrane protein
MRAAAVLFLIFLAAPAAFAADAEITNPMCPVMTDEEILEDLYLDYRGVRVYFCCEGCVDDFKSDPEEYVANLPPAVVADMISIEAWTAAGGWDPVKAESEPSPAEEHPLGVLHPVLVHFPLALTLVAALTALLGLVTAGSFFRNVTTFLLVLAALSIVPSFLTGEEAEEARGVMNDALQERVEDHETLGLISLYVVIGAAVVQLLTYPKRLDRMGFRLFALILVLAAAGVAGYAGYLGGEVIRGPDHLKHLLPF